MSCCAHHDAPRPPAKTTDPVCGMSVDPAATPHHARHAGADYHFCSARCRERFEAEPNRFLAPAEPTGKAQTPQAAIYTCPMHPEVRQAGPGHCPICGMALEPESPASEPAANPEQADFRRRFRIALPLGLAVFVLEMGGHLFGHRWPVDPTLSAWVQFALSTPVVAWAGAPFFHRGWRSLLAWRFNMFTLIALGVGVAYGWSVVALLLPGLFPSAVLGAHGAPPVYFEAAAVITLLVLVGQLLELGARERTSGAIRALLDLAPRDARRLRDDGSDEEVPIAHIRVGDRLRVRPGEAVPVDGEILEGQGALDEALMTGEPLPVERGPGEPVIGGTINRTGGFVMRSMAVGSDTLLSRIVAMVAQAQRTRAPIQRLADQVSGWFVPAVVLAAVLAFAAWWSFGPEPRLTFALVAAVSVLIIACPCALGLATPMSIMVGVGRGARSGVLVRDAEALERLEAIDTLVVDKTGTLTEGRPELAAVEPVGELSEADLLRLAASLERASEHPLADALVRAAITRGLVLAEPREFHSALGKGVSGEVEGRRLRIGSAAFLAEDGLVVEADAGARWRDDGATVLFVAVDGRPAGLLALADPVKADAAATVAALRSEGVRVVMLTGDNRATALAVARRLGVEEVEADRSPEQKAHLVQELRAQGRKVAMAGDGVNDAPALAAADIGLAMGPGADVAIESAGVTLLKGELAAILKARRLSRAVMRNIRQNLAFAFVYNAAGVPIAAGVLYPWFGWLLSPALAAAAMALSSVSVVANALRLSALDLEAKP